MTQRSLSKVCNHMVFVSKIDPNEIDEYIIDKHWSLSKQEELNQFEINNV